MKKLQNVMLSFNQLENLYFYREPLFSTRNLYFYFQKSQNILAIFDLQYEPQVCR